MRAKLKKRPKFAQSQKGFNHQYESKATLLRGFQLQSKLGFPPPPNKTEN